MAEGSLTISCEFLSPKERQAARDFLTPGKSPDFKDEVEVSLSPAEGFGEHDPNLTFSDAIDNVPPEYRHIGAEATFENEDGESITMTVVKMEDGKIMLDGNHPFAGKTVTFKLRVKEIRDATEAEVGSGEVAQQDTPVLH